MRYDFDIDRSRPERPVARFRDARAADAWAAAPWTVRAWLGAAGFGDGASGGGLPGGTYAPGEEDARAAVIDRLARAPARHLARAVGSEFDVGAFVAATCRARPWGGAAGGGALRRA